MSDRTTSTEGFLYDNETIEKKFTRYSVNPFHTDRHYYLTGDRIIETKGDKIKELQLEEVENIESRTAYSKWASISVFGNAGGAISMLLLSRTVLALFFVCACIGAVYYEWKTVFEISSRSSDTNIRIIATPNKAEDAEEFVDALPQRDQQ